MQKKFRTMREEITIIIREKILNRDYKQGDRIKEADLADELGVSRGPIREAFRELEMEGLLTYSSRRGCSVKLLSAKEAAEGVILRASHENLAVRLCKGKYSTETIEKMETIVEEMRKYNSIEDLVDVVRADEAFHDLIVRESGMEKLHDMWLTLSNSNAVIFYTLYHSSYSPNELLADNHNEVLETIKSGDMEKICDAIHYHYLIVAKNLYKSDNIETDYDLDVRL